MAFCSYFKIQPVAGGADRIKKSEWKLVSHDNSQPPRERQLLVSLLSPDSVSLHRAPPLRLYLSIPSTHIPSLFSVSFLGLQHQRFHSPLLFLLRPSSPFPISPRSVPIFPIYLYSRYLWYHHRHQPSLSPSSTALNIRQSCVYVYMCVCVRGGPVEYRQALCICRRYINIYANAHRCALIRICMRGIARILFSSRALHN